MTATEWKKIERMAKGIAYRNGKKLAKDQRKPTDNKREMESEKARKRDYILSLLERYRTEPPDSKERKTMDRLIELHREYPEKGYRDFHGKHVPFKVRHNLLVLAFIIREPKPKSEIMKLLGISQESVYYNVIQQGISDLVQLYYGYEI